jgi:hypothetical protein
MMFEDPAAVARGYCSYPALPGRHRDGADSRAERRRRGPSCALKGPEFATAGVGAASGYLPARAESSSDSAAARAASAADGSWSIRADRDAPS